MLQTLSQRYFGLCAFWMILMCSGCSLLGSGGGIGEERKISGVYRSASGKTIVFDESGSFQYYFSVEDYENNKATVNSTYTIIQDTEIRFNKDDGSAFEESGILTTGDQSFTWDEHPNETFTRVQT